ncbi:MAG: undecaprenyl-phosphate glucose phosphotransferase [Alphaproteobacteria bacterium]|nr:undecaprenyl-phosphate glucose phosphotransferase [Alphaproteobacteria bacterium]
MTSTDGAFEGSQRSTYVEPDIFERVLKGADFVAVLAVAWFFLFKSGPLDAGGYVQFSAFSGVFLSFLLLLFLRETRAYQIASWVRPARASLAATGGSAVVGVLFWYFSDFAGYPLSVDWIVGFSAALLVHFAVTRVTLAVWITSFAAPDCFRQRVAIVGGGPPAEEAIKVLEKSVASQIDIIGIFDDRNDERSPESIRRHEKIGLISELAEYARSNRVDLIIVTIPTVAETRLLQVLKVLWELPVDIRISGQTSRLRFSARSYDYLGDLPLLTVFDRPLYGWAWILKSVFDKILALFFLIAFSPLMLLVAAAVKLESKGPALFKQKRYGFNNELIWVYKFRSMYTEMSDANAVKLVTKDDPRVTAVGRFIRKTSLDELPQFFNVLFGGLSLVGPRPHATQAKTGDNLYEDVLEGYFARHKVKPGITGLAQVHGWRGETDTVEKIANRVKYDLEYIDRWSVMLDLKILLKTPITLLMNSENAY